MRTARAEPLLRGLHPVGLRVHCVSDAFKDDYWLNIGVCFAHDDKDGFNLLLQALPLDGKIVLRTYKEDEEEQPAKGKPSKK